MDWYNKGLEYRSQENWGEAINAFNKAIELESDSNSPTIAAAKAEIEAIYDILRFVNTDLMNP